MTSLLLESTLDKNLEVDDNLDTSTLLNTAVKTIEMRKTPPLFDSQQWEADMKILAEGSDQIPILPDEAFSRESIYSDHD
ncbi:hypothetical protein [Gloeocapsa sp. PCC 73106]|uniref:hypothetical protein n=1 Tax=Gloeocapsa sp. PCC 73106 TaxID=102232 RepID=UPI0002ABAC2C|nr:hypothetical protein [Gloeocapsa sp. PCC 73106]ELR97602.1 hypothetical protein GLO73106DRAFT_00014130 [Gloeocapsa sp. PCC 73106]